MKFPHLLLASTLLAAPLSLSAQHSHKPGTAPHGHQSAGETHAHKSPHGGTVRTAGKYHIELVQHGGELHVYLLDGKENALSVNRSTGTVMLLSTTGKTSTVRLAPVGEDHLVVALPAGLALRTAIVSVKANGSSLSARFEKLDAGKTGKGISTAYACPMNCVGSASDKPGSCPKCGMALVKKA